LDQVPRSDWPVVPLVHLSFQVMVGCGSTMIGVAFLGAFLAWRNPPYTANRWFVMVLVFAGPLGIIALEAGWMVTELGRQPWIIYHIMRTSQAVTSMPHVMRSFIALTGAYVILGIIVVWMLLRHVIASPTDLELEAAQRVEVGNAA
jgi:cytochrome d ubiquinol oxidase subunit I